MAMGDGAEKGRRLSLGNSPFSVKRNKVVGFFKIFIYLKLPLGF